MNAKQFIKQIDEEGQHWSDDTELLAVFFDEYAQIKIQEYIDKKNCAHNWYYSRIINARLCLECNKHELF
jgi:hypothetical protein